MGIAINDTGSSTHLGRHHGHQLLVGLRVGHSQLLQLLHHRLLTHWHITHSSSHTHTSSHSHVHSTHATHTAHVITYQGCLELAHYWHQDILQLHQLRGNLVLVFFYVR